jgi:predicted transcriptional regulator
LIAGRQLGPLEDELLRVLWTRGDATVRELIDDSAVNGAYTTVMTTLDRLYKKGLLERTPEGRAFRYKPKQSEAEIHQNIVTRGLKELLSSAGEHEAPLSFLVDAISDHDAALLEQLQQAVARKRSDLKKKESR